jgi:FMN phosphatase YigB (HAD superfamily)
MWQSMTRKPGAPWKQLYDKYKELVENRRLATPAAKGDVPEVDAPQIWQKILRRLGEKEYAYDANFYGDLDERSDKVAYFFHASLQGVEASAGALRALERVANAGIPQTLLSDGQSFTLVQMLRALEAQGKLRPTGDLLAFDCLTLSFQEGVRKPTRRLYKACLERFSEHGIAPGEILHVGSRLPDDLAVARQLGMRTALYAADKTSLRASKADIQNPTMRPDRLLTDLAQIADILAIA